MNNTFSTKDLAYLLSPQAVRDTGEKIWDLAINGKTHFNLRLEKLPETVEFVIKTIYENYPTLEIPFHSRWGHFRAGKIDRVKLQLDEKIKKLNPIDQAKIKFDLAITSVLLDAGTGGKWSYKEQSTQKSFERSEGLGVASFYLFLENHLSSEKLNYPIVDTLGLEKFKTQILEEVFQVSSTNPLLGVDGRALLLKNLKMAIDHHPEIFIGGRPGGMAEYLVNQFGNNIDAENILKTVLTGLGEIWPGRISIGQANLGDAWNYPDIDGGIAVFHKLSQWMTYSLIEPLLEAGFNIQGVEKLTGLPEYRNGGLFYDMEVITLKDPSLEKLSFAPDHPLIVEWRGLTVALLDQVGMEIQKKLGKSKSELPLAKILEGGTWWAGRKIAKIKRPDGTPPLKVISDGTVF